MIKRLAACVLTLAAASAGAQTVLSTDFNGSLAAQIAPGSAFLAGVQGYAGLGPVSAPFGGSFLRSATANTVTLSHWLGHALEPQPRLPVRRH